MQTTIHQSVSESKQRKFEFMNVRYQLIGRGLTGEILTLYINGQQVKDFPTIDTFYNAMGQQG